MPTLTLKNVEVRNEGSELISYLDFLDGPIDIPVSVQTFDKNGSATATQSTQELPEVLKQTFQNSDGLGEVNTFKPAMEHTTLSADKLVVRAQHTIDDILYIRIYVPYTDQFGRERKAPAALKGVRLENCTQVIEDYELDEDPQDPFTLTLFLTERLLLSIGFKVTGFFRSINGTNLRLVQNVLSRIDLAGFNTGTDGGAPINEYDYEGFCIYDALPNNFTAPELADLIFNTIKKTCNEPNVDLVQAVRAAAFLDEALDRSVMRDPNDNEKPFFDEYIDEALAEWEKEAARRNANGPFEVTRHALFQMAYYSDGGKPLSIGGRPTDGTNAWRQDFSDEFVVENMLRDMLAADENYQRFLEESAED